MKKIGLSTTIALAVATSSVNAANYSVDGRGDAMGGVGVVAADFLSAPFYNPSLAALYRRDDNAGMIIPGVGLTYTDNGKMFKDIKNAANAINSGNASEILSVYESLIGDEIALDIGLTAAFAIPNQFVSMNVFGKIYTESYITADMAPSSVPDIDKLDQSLIKVMGIGVTELGVTFAKYYTLFGQHVSVGASPKIQRVYSVASHASFSNFGFGRIADSTSGDTAFNLDLGAVWFYGPFRVGASAMNIIKRDIVTDKESVNIGGRVVELGDTYELRPNYTIGGGLVGDYYTFSIDYDLVKRNKFIGMNGDDSQMLRAGVEVDIMRQLQLRGGYYTNLAKNDEGTITAGIGLTPLGIITMDLGASYTNANSMGLYINFLGNY
ncbi:conjugal transfer protein TraF [Vibrio sp. S9_S30]|uniref:conjugal transfer protein TraF n=1 Tax=Vibrio sp. S9_S30 TaxID=2720226 RepID=UPI001681A737|nr:conjugal transfer protein TraF [Vibrio sp. S9_S30]MBD1559075.1 conjugal transfer protein TraF [Vibrio sp. S9_S30]